MQHEESIARVLSWLDDRGYYIDFDRSGDDSVDRESKIVSINSTRSLETQLYILLHECGHILIHNSDTIVNGASEVLDKYGEKTKIYKVFTVVEEVEAWKRGLRLAKKLEIPINKTKWNRDVARALNLYMKWAIDPDF